MSATPPDSEAADLPVIVHLVDGTYELFRHFYGLRRFTEGPDPSFGAVIAMTRSAIRRSTARWNSRLLEK